MICICFSKLTLLGIFCLAKGLLIGHCQGIELWSFGGFPSFSYQNPIFLGILWCSPFSGAAGASFIKLKSGVYKGTCPSIFWMPLELMVRNFLNNTWIFIISQELIVSFLLSVPSAHLLYCHNYFKQFPQTNTLNYKCVFLFIIPCIFLIWSLITIFFKDKNLE